MLITFEQLPQAVTDLQRTATDLQQTVNDIKKLLQQPTAPTDELLTVQDAAKFLSLSVPTIYGLIHKGELPAIKRTKRVYFSKFELMTYLKQGRKKTIKDFANDADTYLLTNKKGCKNGN